MVAVLPNQHLIRYLLDTYYSSGDTRPADRTVSSHWQHYSSLFKVNRDINGDLISLTGVGFGNCQWRNPVDRLLDQVCVLSYVVRLPRRSTLLTFFGVAGQLSRAMGLDPTLDVFRQVCTLDLLAQFISPEKRAKRLHVLMIGDGYGVLSALFKKVFPNSTISMVDIGKTLLFQAYGCQRVFPNAVHELSPNVNDMSSVDFVYCPADRLDTLDPFKFDLAVNVASMQEMDPSVIAQYFDFLRGHLYPANLFYCCNRELKELPGGEVTEFLRYPWRDDDQYLVDGFCPWHEYFLSRSSSRNGPRVFGIRVPFVNYYDGRLRHRLAILATNVPTAQS